MARSGERYIPATAEALFEAHPGLAVDRDSLGHIDVHSSVEALDHLLGFDTLIRMTQMEGQSPGSGLAFISRLSTGEWDTRLAVPTSSGTVADVKLEHAGVIMPAHVIAMACAGVAMLDCLHRLSEAEQRKFTSIPFANAKVYDWQSPEVNTSGRSLFAIARRILLVETSD